MAYYWKGRWGWRLVLPFPFVVNKMYYCEEKNCKYGDEENGFHFCKLNSSFVCMCVKKMK